MYLWGGQHPLEAASTFTSYWYKKIFGIDAKFNDYSDQINAIKTIIGNDVWIGNGAIINSGLKIGNGAVIGCGAIVTHDVPDYAIVVGQPARILRYRFDQQTIALLSKLQWWNWSQDTIKKNIPMLSRKMDKITLDYLLNVNDEE